MGIRCDLDPAFSFVYQADVGHGLIEHEYDHVFVGTWSGAPRPDPAEVAEWRWIRPPDLDRELARQPKRFTPWFPLAFDELRTRSLV